MSSAYSAFNTVAFDKTVGIFEADYWRSDEDKASGFLRKPQLLVAGVGTGRTLPYLLEKGFRIESIDISPEMVRACKERFPDVPCAVMDIQRTSYSDESFDSVFLPFHTMALVDDVQATLKEIKRILKPGGTLVFNMHNRFRMKNLLGSAWKPKRILDTFDGGRASIWVTRATFFDVFRFRRVFPKTSIYGRISLQNIPNPNWKDRVLLTLPFLDRSLYFFCTKG